MNIHLPFSRAATEIVFFEERGGCFIEDIHIRGTDDILDCLDDEDGSEYQRLILKYNA